MLHIGYYYTDEDVFYLYKSNVCYPIWVTNIVYYDRVNNRFYSPNIKNLMENSRDFNNKEIPAIKWKALINQPFVLR